MPSKVKDRDKYSEENDAFPPLGALTGNQITRIRFFCEVKAELHPFQEYAVCWDLQPPPLAFGPVHTCRTINHGHIQLLRQLL